MSLTERLAIGLLAVTCVPGCALLEPARAAAPGVRPLARSMGASIESQDPALAASLLVLRVAPSAAAHRQVAAEYRRLKIDDTAFDHLTAATRLDPSDAAAYDGLARIWRDWGFPDLGLADASRAVFHAPASAAVRNTRGTLLAALGQDAAARQDFAAALALDPSADYAGTNLRRLDERARSKVR
jgi:Tfp pilus assembly protein PilF